MPLCYATLLVLPSKIRACFLAVECELALWLAWPIEWRGSDVIRCPAPDPNRPCSFHLCPFEMLLWAHHVKLSHSAYWGQESHGGESMLFILPNKWPQGSKVAKLITKHPVKIFFPDKQRVMFSHNCVSSISWTCFYYKIIHCVSEIQI